jgi:hypothetical protein
MLEQPPERSLLEIEAEVAAAAQASPQRNMHGCFRFVVWCMPTFLFYVILAAALYSNYAFLNEAFLTYTLIIAFTVMAGITFGIGILNGCFSKKIISSSPEVRRREILWYAAAFTVMQFWIIPALTVVMIVICVIVVDAFGILDL